MWGWDWEIQGGAPQVRLPPTSDCRHAREGRPRPCSTPAPVNLGPEEGCGLPGDLCARWAGKTPNLGKRQEVGGGCHDKIITEDKLVFPAQSSKFSLGACFASTYAKNNLQTTTKLK